MAVKTNIDNGVLTIDVTGCARITVDPSDYPASLIDYAALHGFKQKYTDAAALGAGASDAEKYDAIMAVVTHHRTTGEWNRTPGAGDGASGDGLLVRAVMEAYGLDRDTARTQVAAIDKKTQAAMRGSDELAPIIARLRTEKKPKAATPDALSAAQAAMAALRGMKA